MKQGTFITTLFLLSAVVVLAGPPEEHHDCPAPISVIGTHVHTSGELMFSYRFMAMDMRGLQSGTDAVETADVLKDFMMAPTAMDMRMHMLGVMFAPHDKITFMGMTSYQQRSMEMEGAHQHAAGHHDHPVGMHEMSSAGSGTSTTETAQSDEGEQQGQPSDTPETDETSPKTPPSEDTDAGGCGCGS